MNDPIDTTLARVKAFVRFRDLHPDQSHTSDELNDAIALAAEVESLRSRLAEADAHGKAQQQWAHEWRDKHDALTAENAALREERALIIQRAENAEAALAQWEYSAKYDDVHYDALRARLAEADALLREAAAWRTVVECIAPEIGGLIMTLARIDAHLAERNV